MIEYYVVVEMPNGEQVTLSRHTLRAAAQRVIDIARANGVTWSVWESNDGAPVPWHPEIIEPAAS